MMEDALHLGHMLTGIVAHYGQVSTCLLSVCP